MKRLLELIKAKPFLFLIAILAIFLFVVAYQCGTAKEAKRTAKIFMDKADDVKVETEELIKKKDEENEKLEKDNLKKDIVIAEANAENEDLISKQKENEIKMEEMEAEIAKEKPDELINRARGLLDTDEIWWNIETEKVEFSLESFRLGVTRWADWSDFTLEREPNYKQQILNAGIVKTTQEGKILNLVIEIGNLKITTTQQQKNYDALDTAFSEFRRYAKKKGGVGRDLLWGGVGYGVGKLLEGIFGNK